MGNHESFPVNVYDYQGDRESMLIGGLAEAWKQWLDQQAYDMLRTKGFFSIELPELNNLKIISLNTQAQNNLNFFLLKDSTDPGNMLQWL
jgi:sphingomyelin phosphodiesterase